MNIVKLNSPTPPGLESVVLAERVSLAGPAGAGGQRPARATSVLQRRYDAAQKYQAAHDLDHAAQQYRIFIADALGELALGRAHAGEYDKAANDFDTALNLVPDFPTDAD